MPDPGLLRTSRELFLSVAAGGMPALETWVIDRLTSLFEEEEIVAGTRVFAAGEPIEFIYFMREGRLQLSREGVPPWIMSGRWVIGGGDAFLERPYPRTGVALTNLSLLRVPAEDWIELVEDSFQLTRGAVSNAVRGVAALELRLWESQRDPRGAAMVVAPHGKRPMSFVDRLSTFAGAGMFRSAGVQVLTDLVGLQEERSFAAGEALWTRKAAPREAFVVVEGEVVAERMDRPLAVRFGPGSVVAGVAALGDPAKEWEARALSPTRALSLGHEDWLDLMEDHFDLARSALGQLALARERILEQLAAGKSELELI
jgi:CRP-like cAMP-binding protein